MKIYFKHILLGFMAISACKKEEKVALAMKGKWKITEIRFNKDSTITDFAPYNHTIEFLEYKNAYTASLRAIYTIDYLDTLKKDIKDSTVMYDIKGDNLSITKTLNSTKRFIQFRYRIDEYKGDNLYLNRTPLDTVDAYIKAIRIKQ